MEFFRQLIWIHIQYLQFSLCVFFPFYTLCRPIGVWFVCEVICMVFIAYRLGECGDLALDSKRWQLWNMPNAIRKLLYWMHTSWWRLSSWWVFLHCLPDICSEFYMIFNSTFIRSMTRIFFAPVVETHIGKNFMNFLYLSVWGACSHCFHMHCIVKWLNSQPMSQQCPMCRQAWKFNDKWSLPKNN